jgi:hypothetical protein
MQNEYQSRIILFFSFCILHFEFCIYYKVRMKWL